MKVVLDTKVLIAAFISHGVCNELLEYCAIHHEITLSPFILDEVREKLVRKFDFSTREASQAIQLLKSRVVLVTPHELDHQLCRDQDDDTIIGTALAGDCACIVTGDKDLLVLQRIQGVRIVSPNEFWSREKQGY